MVKRFQSIDDERRRYQLPLAFRKRQQEDDDPRQTSSAITDQHQMYGRDEEKDKIVEFPTKHASSIDRLSVYPVVGMGGLGKTTLFLCLTFPNPRYHLKMVSEPGSDPGTCGLWAHHASAKQRRQKPPPLYSLRHEETHQGDLLQNCGLSRMVRRSQTKKSQGRHHSGHSTDRQQQW